MTHRQWLGTGLILVGLCAWVAVAFDGRTSRNAVPFRKLGYPPLPSGQWAEVDPGAQWTLEQVGQSGRYLVFIGQMNGQDYPPYGAGPGYPTVACIVDADTGRSLRSFELPNCNLRQPVPVNSLTGPDGLVVLSYYPEISGRKTTAVLLLDVKQGTTRQIIIKMDTGACWYALHGQLLAIADQDEIRVVNIESGKCAHQFRHPPMTDYAALHWVGNALALVGRDPHSGIALMDPTTGQVIRTIGNELSWQGSVVSTAVSGTRMLIGLHDPSNPNEDAAGLAFLADTATDIPPIVLRNPTAVSRNVRFLFRIASSDWLRRWWSDDLAEDYGYACAFAGDHALVGDRHESMHISGEVHSTMYLYDANTGRPASSAPIALPRPFIADRESVHIFSPMLGEPPHREPPVCTYRLKDLIARFPSVATLRIRTSVALVAVLLLFFGWELAGMRAGDDGGPVWQLLCKSGARQHWRKSRLVVAYSIVLGLAVLLSQVGVPAGFVSQSGTSQYRCVSPILPWALLVLVPVFVLMTWVFVRRLWPAVTLLRTLRWQNTLSSLLVLPVGSDAFAKACLRWFSAGLFHVCAIYALFWCVIGALSGALTQMIQVGALGEFTVDWVASVALFAAPFWLVYWLLLYPKPRAKIVLLSLGAIGCWCSILFALLVGTRGWEDLFPYRTLATLFVSGPAFCAGLFIYRLLLRYRFAELGQSG